MGKNPSILLGVSVDVFSLTLEEAKRSLKEGWGMVFPALKENLYLYRKGNFKLEDLLSEKDSEGY